MATSDGPITQGIKDAINGSVMTPYAIAKAVTARGKVTGKAGKPLVLTPAQIYKFQGGKMGLSLAVLDEIAAVLGLVVRESHAAAMPRAEAQVPSIPLDSRAAERAARREERRGQRQADPERVAFGEQVKSIKAALWDDLADNKPSVFKRDAKPTKPTSLPHPEDEDDSILHNEPPPENAERNQTRGPVTSDKLAQLRADRRRLRQERYGIGTPPPPADPNRPLFDRNNMGAGETSGPSKKKYNIIKPPLPPKEPRSSDDGSWANYEPSSEIAQRMVSQWDVSGRDMIERIQHMRIAESDDVKDFDEPPSDWLRNQMEQTGLLGNIARSQYASKRLPHIRNPGIIAMIRRYGDKSVRIDKYERARFWEFISSMQVNNPRFKEIDAIPNLADLYRKIAKRVSMSNVMVTLGAFITPEDILLEDENAEMFYYNLHQLLLGLGIANGVDGYCG